MNAAPPPQPQLGVYLHFPYYAQRCPYCDFTLTTRPFSHERYADAVLSELEMRARGLGEAPPLTSLYFGGGTPGLWEPAQLRRVISRIGERLGWVDAPEVTLEANPSELTLELAEAWRAAGVNRLSLGTQSFDQARLTWLGRTHSPALARRAVQWARAAGFENLNLDLMHGFIGQRVEEALADLEATLSLSPEHISLYQLTVEERTSFGARARRGEQLIEPEARLVELYEALSRRLERAGLPLYEVSNAARSGFESRHNKLYWTMGQYLALGAGAHGLLWGAGPQGEAEGLRWSNVKQPERYIEAALNGRLSALEEERATLDQEALFEEQILVGFRLHEGLEVSAALRSFVGERAQAQVEAGLMLDEGGRWRATARGRLLLNRLIMGLLT